MCISFAIAICMHGPDGILELASRSCGFSIKMQMVKTQFIVGEPIAVDVRLSNTSNSDAAIIVEGVPYTFLNLRHVLDFDLTKTKLTRPKIVGRSISTERRTLQRDSGIKEVIYLQDFMSPFGIGHYRIPVTFWQKACIDRRDINIYASRLLEFKVEPEDEKKLIEALSTCFDSFRTAKTAEDKVRAASELSLFDSPNALPFLIRALNQTKKKAPFEPDTRCFYAIEGSIRRFSKRHDAFVKVDEWLDSKKPPLTPAEFLSLLTIWEFKLPERVLKEFQKSTDPVVIEKLRAYVEIMKQRMKDTD